MSRIWASLPTLGVSMDDDARAVMRVLADAGPGSGAQSISQARTDPATCPNCGVRVESLRSPYCSDRCREVSAFVRQFRAAVADSTIQATERQMALGQTLWYLLGGGRPLRRKLIPQRSRDRVIARCGGLCTQCGAPATDVDHIATACNREINLTAVCAACSRTRPFGDPRVLDEPGTRELLSELAERVAADAPLRPCDDATTWDWRRYLANRTLTT